MKKQIIAIAFFYLTFFNSFSQDKDFKKEILTYDLSNIWMTEHRRFTLYDAANKLEYKEWWK